MEVQGAIIDMHLRGELTIPTDEANPVSLWLCTAIRRKEEQVEVRLTAPAPQIEEEGACTKLVPAKSQNVFDMP